MKILEGDEVIRKELRIKKSKKKNKYIYIANFIDKTR